MTTPRTRKSALLAQLQVEAKEQQAREYNRAKAYLPTSRDVAKAWIAQGRRTPLQRWWNELCNIMPFKGGAPL